MTVFGPEKLDGFLSAYMLGGSLDTAEGGVLALDLLFNGLFIGQIFHSEMENGAAGLGFIINDAGAAEQDDASEIGRQLLGDDIVPVDDTDRHLVAGGDGVKLVTCFGTVEIELSVTENIVDRHGVRVSAVADEAEHGRFSAFKYFDALVI